jgi:16S rRNA (adenine1518-N6/adenine1519-N6)-dimethyltransferase
MEEGRGGLRRAVGAEVRGRPFPSYLARMTDRPAPKKSLGQNFLVDRNIAQKIVREFDPKPGELVVEIGPGQGALTGMLVESGCRLVAVELDPRMVELLVEQHGTALEIIQQDVLRVDFGALARERGADRLRVIGNIPYYITSPILFHLIEQRAVISDASLMMQREVADRLVAKTRSKDYGILAVMTQTYSEPRLVVNVGPKCFFPPPRVNSAVVSFRFRDAEGISGIERQHQTIVRAAFNQRRKTLRNALASVIADGEQRDRVFAGAGIGATQRAEELTPDDFIRLARTWAEEIARPSPPPHA